MKPRQHPVDKPPRLLAAVTFGDSHRHLEGDFRRQVLKGQLGQSEPQNSQVGLRHLGKRPALEHPRQLPIEFALVLGERPHQPLGENEPVSAQRFAVDLFGLIRRLFGKVGADVGPRV